MIGGKMIGICDFCKKEGYLKIGCNGTKICPECAMVRKDAICIFCGRPLYSKKLCGWHNLPICSHCNKCANCNVWNKPIQPGEIK